MFYNVINVKILIYIDFFYYLFCFLICIKYICVVFDLKRVLLG